MQGDEDVLDHLNGVLKNELTAINQTFLHARMLNNWGIGALGKRVYSRSIRAMKDADEVIERVLFLEGLPSMQELGKLWIGQDVQEIIDCELNLEMTNLKDLRAAVVLCEQKQDYISRDELTEIIENHEEYVDWIEAQLYQIDKMGMQNYIQLMAGKGEN